MRPTGLIFFYAVSRGRDTETMGSEPGASLILWTARISVMLYAAAVIRCFGTSSRTGWQYLWTGSWLMCVVHVLCAFQFEHYWSHAAALKHTAVMTHRVTGLQWGGGLYINYLFLTVWMIHAVTCLRKAKSDSEASPGYWFHAVAAFMMFNATAVFGPVWWWIPVGVFCAILLVLRRLPSGPSSDVSS